MKWFFQGGPVMYLLFGCSLVAVTIIIERTIFWVREKNRVDLSEIDQFFEYIHSGELQQVRQLAQQTGNPLFQSMIEALGHGKDPRMHAVHEALELEIEKALDRTRAYLVGLDTIATLTPLLGIFGTVLGIIQSFNVIGASSIPDPQAVGVGLAEALISTAAGLAVAMPSLIFHNFFMSLSEKHISQLDKYHREFEIHSEEIESEDTESSESQ